MITDRDWLIVQLVCHFYVLNRPQIQQLCFPNDQTGRAARRRLQELVTAGLISRHRAQVLYPDTAPASSVYYPSRKGCELLAERTGDERFLVTPTQCPLPHHVMHWLAVTDTHIKLDRAIAGQNHVRLDGWINEWDVVNKDEVEPQKRFRLYTLLSDNPKLVCAPDSSFMMTVMGFSKVFYLEQDRETSGAAQVAARKCKGYAELAARQGHTRHFPESNVPTFTVLCVAPQQRRRDALRKAMNEKVGAVLWKFAAATELTPETFLHAPIFYPCVGDPVPLVKLESLPS
jgi:hypothetical protein